MRSTRFLLFFPFSLLLIFLLNPAIARADDNDADDYDVTARVVRLSLIQGDVSVRRHDSNQWEAVRLNTPLVEGDSLSTGSAARAEIQIDGRNFLRIALDSELRIVTLRNEGIALSLTQGTVTLRLARFDKAHEYFEIDAPRTTFAAESKGLYRIDAGRDGHVSLKVRDGGRARVYSASAGFTVGDGHTATLNSQADDGGDWQLGNALGPDDWDEWVFSREQNLLKEFKYDQRHYDADLWGAEDLDSYGTWANTNEYGWIWQPNITVINSYSDWAPYRYGSWVWCAPYGWTWIGDEPFGWATYHYGRWVFYNGHWVWCPSGFYRGHRSWWRPALVIFISIEFNSQPYYCWYPLHYHQRDPHSRNYQARDRWDRHRDDWDNRRHNPGDHGAVSYIPRREFGNDRGRQRAADDALARRVVTTEPLALDLPGRRAGGGHTVVREPSDDSAATAGAAQQSDFGRRQTGAGTRQPGVPLDNELRRSRVFQGRDPQSDLPNPSGGAGLHAYASAPLEGGTQNWWSTCSRIWCHQCRMCAIIIERYPFNLGIFICVCRARICASFVAPDQRAGSPRSQAQTCHEHGQHGGHEWSGDAELRHGQPQPHQFVQNAAES